MPPPLLLLFLLTLLTTTTLSLLTSLARNIRAAKASGLPYTLTPVSISQKSWLATQRTLLPLLHLLPAPWTDPWLPLLIFDAIHPLGHAPFARLAADTFLAVSPRRIVLWTCDPAAILQITAPARRVDFQKPVRDLDVLNIFGPTVTASEGEEGRRYRRIVGGAFAGRGVYEGVWGVAVRGAGALARREGGGVVRDVNFEVAGLTMGVISTVCLGREVDGLEGEAAGTRRGIGRAGREQGHAMGYHEAFRTSLEHMGVIYLTPRWLLRFSPLRLHRIAWRSFSEWRRYVQEIVDAKTEELRHVPDKEPSNLLESLIASSNPLLNNPPIPSAAIHGNIWVFILGGYHTSANTLEFIFLLLACFPAAQTRLHRSLDATLGSRPPATWSYATDFPQLLNGYTGAVLAETLRLFGVLPFIPKTTGDREQVLRLGERDVVVPRETLVLINTNAVHRHPVYWPKAADADPDVPFEPERWLPPSPRSSHHHHEDATLDPHPTPTLGDDDEASSPYPGLFHPEPGTYIPFSEGTRSCLGKRFAQVEICGILARVMQEARVELVVEGVEEDASEAEKQEAWERTRRRTLRELRDGVGFKMALEMRRRVALRFVRRETEGMSG